MNNWLSYNSIQESKKTKNNSVESLAQQWAKKYMQNLKCDSEDEALSNELSGSSVISREKREQTVQKLMHSLRSVSAQAWNKTESLLAKEVKRHRLDPKLINPWDVAADSFRIYEKALEVYTQQDQPRHFQTEIKTDEFYSSNNSREVYTHVTPSRLATVIGLDLGVIRKKYTCDDPRIIGFVSMQFHYTSQMLLELLPPIAQQQVGAYFKVIDDHLYMPLHRAYEAAATHDRNSEPLSAVQKLVPACTEIAQKVCLQVVKLYPSYHSYTGLLNDSVVLTSSIRDVEMFQVYLWVCALEKNISAIQQELFPLCVMLYPTLKVKWELVRQMLYLLGQEIRDRTTPEQAATILPYFQTLWEMFSPEVFIDASHKLSRF